MAILSDSANYKLLVSPDCNYIFNKQTGDMSVWGETIDDDPQFSPYGPFLIDIEISTICHGPSNKLCQMCYKSNKPSGKNMTLDEFKDLFSKLPKTITQIAFGIGDVDANPDMFAIFEHARNNGVIPNVTINGSRMTDEIADNLVKVCGAVSVSYYDDDCFDTVKMLTDRGMKQVNIHMLLSKETLEKTYNCFAHVSSDTRLAKLNAVVLLGVKAKGRGVGYHSVSKEDFIKLVDYLFLTKPRFGFDSCSANKFLKYIEDKPEYAMLKELIEPCESGLFSGYIDVERVFYPCSFVTTPYVEGIDLKNSTLDFMQDVWYNPKTLEWRAKLLKCGRSCPVFEV